MPVETPVRGRPVAPAAAPDAPATAAPATAENGAPTPNAAPPKRQRKGRKAFEEETREFHPALNVKPETRQDGGTTYVATTQLEAVPEDYDEEKHIPLRRLDFKDDAAFLEYKAHRLQVQADALRADAAELRKLGTREEQENMRKLQAMMKNMAQIQEMFESKDIDFSKVMEKVKANIEKKG